MLFRPAIQWVVSVDKSTVILLSASHCCRSYMWGRGMRADMLCSENWSLGKSGGKWILRLDFIVIHNAEILHFFSGGLQLLASLRI